MAGFDFPAVGNAGVFSIPNTVVDSFLKEADETALKVLLYYYRQGGGFSSDDICSFLSITASQLAECINYWISKGVLKTEGNAVVPDVSCIAFNSHPTEKKAADKPRYDFLEVSEMIRGNKPLYSLIQSVQAMFPRPLSPEAINTLYSFYDYYGFPIEVIYTLVKFCCENGKDNIKYIEQVAHTWYTDGICSEDRAHAYIEKYNIARTRESAVRRIFGISARNLSVREKRYISKWTESYAFTDEMITLAYDRCVDSIGNSSFAYIDKVLSSWFKQGIATPDDLDKEQAPEKPKRTKKGRGKTGEATFSAEDFAKWSFDSNYDKEETK